MVQDFNPRAELPRLASSISSQFQTNPSLVFSTFRIAITELPHKLTHYAALIALLSVPVPAAPVSSNPAPTKPAPALAPGLPARPTDEVDAPAAADAEEGDGRADGDSEMKEEGGMINVGREILNDLCKAFQGFLDERKWRSVRYCVSHPPRSCFLDDILSQWILIVLLPYPLSQVLLFATLSTLEHPLVSPQSLTTLLASFLAVLDEPGLRASRGDTCVRIVVEALLRVGGGAGPEAASLRAGVEAYAAGRRVERELFGEGETGGQFDDHLEALVKSLGGVASSGLDVFSTVGALVGGPGVGVEGEALFLPLVLVPPEVEEGDVIPTGPAPADSSGLRGDEGVGYEGVRVYLRLFDDHTVPSSSDPSGIALRSMIHDMVDLYEVNRKECANILLSLPQWFEPGTFSTGNDDDDDAHRAKPWILEHLVVETILSELFSLPAPSLPAAYYHALLTELCRASPQTVAPALGKCVRRLYGGLGGELADGYPLLDPEGVRRFAEWFAVHLSNFSFAWGWADWAPDMDCSTKHPKRVFVRRVIELEIRLSYYDRVKGTIPPAMLETGVVADEAPGPEYEYEDKGHKYAAAAEQLLKAIRAKALIPDVEDELAAFQADLEREHGLTVVEAEAAKRDMAIQTILHVGSRSFSHFLNVLERYLALLRSLSPTANARAALLRTVARFWRRNAQFLLIVVDKLLQYRLVDAQDVVEWVFAPAEGEGRRKTWSDLEHWAALSMTLRALEGRAKAAKLRWEGLKAEAEATAAGKPVDGAAEAEAEAEAALASTDESEAVRHAREAHAAVQRELDEAVVEVVRQFARLLPEGVDRDDWETWWVEGWVRELCRGLAGGKVLGGEGLGRGLEELGLGEASPVGAILESARVWEGFA